MIKETSTIQWIDSSCQDNQTDSWGFPKPIIITSIGFVVEETDAYIVLARDDMGEGDFRGLLAIPKIAILI